MIDADRAAFMDLLGDLFGAHSRNVNTQIAGGYWKGLKHMSLEEFRTCVEKDLEKLQTAERGVSRPPTVAELWDLKRNVLPVGKAPDPDAPSPYHGDHWSIAGNLALLHHISANAMREPPHQVDYAPDIKGPHTEAIAKILVRWKNAWVTDMREAEANGNPLDGKLTFLNCMAEADKQAREYLERYVHRQVAA